MRCTCARDGRHCSNCIPARLGNCMNSPDSEAPSCPERQHLETRSGAASSLNQDCPIDFESALPNYEPLILPNFSWGVVDSTSFSNSLEVAYTEIVHWRRNLFSVPSGKVGEAFVFELSRLFRAYAEATALESVALKATIVLPVLTLQKPCLKSKPKDHIKHLKRRLEIWKEGNLDVLLAEGRTIQNCFKRKDTNSKLRQTDTNTDSCLARDFSNLMFKGQTKAAIKLLSAEERAGYLRMDERIPMIGFSETKSVHEVLVDKHPPAQPALPQVIINSSDSPSLHPIYFDSLDANMIRLASKHVNGAAGPSGLDAYAWRRLCSAFGSASEDLCHSIALLAKRLCISFVDPQGLAPFLACRLIALNKNPGVRPIGIGEVVRRIVAKSVLFVLRPDILEAAGTQQLCAGQVAGIDAAIHTMRCLFEKDDTEAMLFVDASNAFNALNRHAALRNIMHICPPLSTVLVNNYRSHTNLFMDGVTILSQEGTTQGDPLAMSMYALATLPLINKANENEQVTQAWYADDATATGSLNNLLDWWKKLLTLGPMYGYHVNPSKTWLLTKEHCLSKAQDLFERFNVQITTEGRPLLGSVVGSLQYVEEFVEKKVSVWLTELNLLVQIAETQPHAAFSAFTHGISSKWLHLCRTTPNISHLLQPLEKLIRTKLLPQLTKRVAPSDLERDLFALPARLGGLGIKNPIAEADSEYEASVMISSPISELIICNYHELPSDTQHNQTLAKSEIKIMRRRANAVKATLIRSNLSGSLQRAMDLSNEKGASNWLTALPIQEFGFSLHKGAFTDAISLRYGWNPPRTPLNCPCGSSFSLSHSLSCPKGGLPTVRHNEIRDFTASLLSKVCHSVAVEPTLQPINGELLNGASANVQDGARLDIVANGVWGGPFERSYFDVKVFNPLAHSNIQPQLSTTYRNHEKAKKRLYEQRIREVEHSSFTPLILSTTGGLGQAATIFYKRLASLLSEKWGQSYNSTVGWLRCRLSFSLLRASIMCIRGARSSANHVDKSQSVPIDIIIHESKFALN